MYDQPKLDHTERNVGVGLVILGVVILLFIVGLLSSIRTIGTGKVGVVTKFGQVTGRELGEGLHFVTPFWIETVKRYDVKTQKEEQSATAATADLQDATAKLVVNYQINGGDVSKLHQTVGDKYRDIVLIPAIQSAYKSGSAGYTAVELITKRAEVESKVTASLRKRFEERKLGISIQDVNLVDLQFSKEFTQAIEQRQVAEQNAKRAEFNLQQARLDAQSQQVQAETLTDNYLQMKAIEKWNGVMPNAVGDGNIFSIPVR